MRWLEKEARGKYVFFYIIACLAIKCVYTYTVLLLLNLLHAVPTSPTRVPIPLVWYIPFWLFAMALMEEIMFRLPLVLCVELKWSVNKTLLVAAALSALFGYAHGGFRFILFQGVFGFLYSILFLKCGGLERRYVKALLVSTTIHFLWNGTLAAIAYASGLTSF